MSSLSATAGAARTAPADATLPLAPVAAAQRSLLDTHPVPGLVPDLLIPDDRGWLPATALSTGAGMGRVLAAAERRWRGVPHAAAARAWKVYAYRLGLPAVLGWAARRIPLLYPCDVLIRICDGRHADSSPLFTLGLRRSVRVAVLATDPIARARLSSVLAVADESALLALLRRSLLGSHVAPILARLHDESGVGVRQLLGSLASGMAYSGLETAEVLSASFDGAAGLLPGLGLDDLVDIVVGPDGARTVARRTCCLSYALHDSHICQGCVLRRRDG